MTDLQPSHQVQRLNKHLALSLGVPRRQADDLIAKGQIKINNEMAVLGARFLPEHDTITYNGKPVNKSTEFEYILFNKPINYVCSRKKQGNSPTIYSILPKNFHHLKPVGRLDKNSSGLLLLSNDGDFILKMTHPSYNKTKNYLVTLNKPLEPLHQQMISDFGIQLEDGPSQLFLEKLNDNRKEWRITMHEGRNRQIRRTFKALNYTVTKLHRTNFGNYNLGELKRGEYKKVSKL